MNVLVGIIYQNESLAAGSVTTSYNLIKELSTFYNVHLVMIPDWGYKNDGEEAVTEKCVWKNYNGLVIKPKTNLSYGIETGIENLTAGQKEYEYISAKIQEYIHENKIDLVHVLEWEELKTVLFDAADKANIPYVFSLFDYRTVCSRIFLRFKNKSICSGPGIIKCAICNTSKHKMLSQLTTTVFNYKKSYIHHYIEKKRFLNYFINKAKFLLPQSQYQSSEVQKVYNCDDEKMKIVHQNYLGTDIPYKLHQPRQSALQIGYLQRVSKESGIYFILKAWKMAKVDKENAVLNIYCPDGGAKLLNNSRYVHLIKEGNVVIYEGTIRNKISEVMDKLDAVICAYQFKLGASIVGLEGISYGVPAIAPVWVNDGIVNNDGIINGVNGLTYENWNVASLSNLLQQVSTDHQLIHRLFETCKVPEEFTYSAFIKNHVEVYKNSVSTH